MKLFCIMRSDYSAILADENYYLIWSSLENCIRAAKNFHGRPVPFKVAKKILIINKMIGKEG